MFYVSRKSKAKWQFTLQYIMLKYVEICWNMGRDQECCVHGPTVAWSQEFVNSFGALERQLENLDHLVQELALSPSDKRRERHSRYSCPHKMQKRKSGRSWKIIYLWWKEFDVVSDGATVLWCLFTIGSGTANFDIPGWCSGTGSGPTESKPIRDTGNLEDGKVLI